MFCYRFASRATNAAHANDFYFFCFSPFLRYLYYITFTNLCQYQGFARDMGYQKIPKIKGFLLARHSFSLGWGLFWLNFGLLASHLFNHFQHLVDIKGLLNQTLNHRQILEITVFGLEIFVLNRHG